MTLSHFFTLEVFEHLARGFGRILDKLSILEIVQRLEITNEKELASVRLEDMIGQPLDLI